MIAALLLPLALGAGDPGDFAGPGRVCFKYSMFDLVEGEQLSARLGVESASFSIKGAGGDYAIVESEIFAEPEQAGELVLDRPEARIYRSREGGKVRYRLYGRPDFSPDRDKMMLMISGPALRGTAQDRAIYARLRIAEPDRASRKHAYLYGWEYMLEEPEAK